MPFLRPQNPWNLIQYGKTHTKWHFQGTQCLSAWDLSVSMPLGQIYVPESPLPGRQSRARAAFHLHWSDTGDSALPLQGTARALLRRGDYSSNPSIIMVWLNSRDLWAGKENENYRCPVPMTEPPYISSNKACDNSSINSHSNRSERQLIIAAI